MSYALRLAAGYVNNGGPGGAGSNGNYWSSTINDATNAYRLNFDSGNINPANNGNRYNGYSVRCVAYSDPTPQPQLAWLGFML